MNIEIYKGIGGNAPTGPQTLPIRSVETATHPSNYLADKGLVDAANTALLLGLPLLLTGDPGTGKTQFASSLSWEVGFAPAYCVLTPNLTANLEISSTR